MIAHIADYLCLLRLKWTRIGRYPLGFIDKLGPSLSKSGTNTQLHLIHAGQWTGVPDWDYGTVLDVPGQLAPISDLHNIELRVAQPSHVILCTIYWLTHILHNNILHTCIISNYLQRSICRVHNIINYAVCVIQSTLERLPVITV